MEIIKEISELNDIDSSGSIEGSNNEESELDQNISEEKDDLINLILKDREKVCFGCDTEKEEFYVYDCGNGLCKECNIEHIKAQLEKYKTKIFCSSIKFICPGSCKCVADIDKIVLSMTLKIREFYYDIMFKMYASRTDDILSCPRSNCSFAGIIKRSCKDKYECNLCNHKWSEYSNISQFKLLDFYRIYEDFFSISNFKTRIIKFRKKKVQ